MHKGVAPFDGLTQSALLGRTRFELIRCGVPDHAGFDQAVRSGLTDSPKHLPCRFLYDERGSKLFEAICRVPEYYLTRAEEEIICARAQEISARFGDEVRLVDLGSGSSKKTRVLISELLRQGKRVRYMPIDISPTALENASQKLLRDHSQLEITAVMGEYTEGLKVLSEAATEPKLVLWLGSNIGNLDRSEAANFLELIRKILTPEDCLLVGIDLHKDRSILENAYNDSAGVTSRFSQNILARINREFGGEFDLSRFRHHAFYNDHQNRIEISLVSDRSQQVRIPGLDLRIAFDAGEAIHTEHSYKYSFAQIEDLTLAVDMRLERQWLDARGLFSLNMLTANHRGSKLC
jgi:L-histidine Nalpha-methyltransferase